MTLSRTVAGLRQLARHFQPWFLQLEGDQNVLAVAVRTA